MENLNKENFFNDLMERFPKAVGLFCAWIDEYKIEVDWDNMFYNHHRLLSVKFHSAPIEMQMGILSRFFYEVDEKFEDTDTDLDVGCYDEPDKMKANVESCFESLNVFLTKKVKA